MGDIEEEDSKLQQHKKDLLLHYAYEEKLKQGQSLQYADLMDEADTLGVSEAELDQYARNTASLALVQPHGVFLALDQSSGKVLACSSNSTILLAQDANEIVGTVASDMFTESSKILQAMNADTTSLWNPLALTVKKTGQAVHVVLEKKPWCATLEVEDADGEQASMGGLWASHSRVRSIVDGLRTPKNLDDLIAFTVAEIQDFSKYDRVMVYKLHEDLHGEVIGEASAPHIDSSYLGLHFPATDIPQRAREVFTSCRVRQVVDTAAKPADIIWEGRTNEPMLNSNMTLRAPHPCHVEYLHSMGIRASLVLSVMAGQRLWGLIVCHKYDATHFLSFPKRSALEFIVQVFSSRVAGLEEAERSRDRAVMTQTQTQLVEQMLAKRSDALLDQSSEQSMETSAILGLVSNELEATLQHLLPGCSSAAILYGSNLCTVGRVPPEELIRQIVSRVKEGHETCWSTHELSKHHPEAAEHCEVAAGVMVVVMGNDGAMLWFRPEVIETVQWAGDPSQAVLLSKDNRNLLPRQSFEAFSKIMSQTSQRWTEPQREVAEKLATLVLEVRKSCDAEKMLLVNAEHHRTKAWYSTLSAELNAMMQSSSVPIFASSLSGDISFWNEKMTSVTGYSRTEAMKMRVYDVVVEDMRSVVKDTLDTVGQVSDTATMEITLAGKDGQSVYVVLNCTLRRDALQKPCGAFFVGQDVTEAREALQRCERIEQGYERLLESGVVPAFGVDLDGNVNEWNGGMTSMSRLSKADVLGKPLLGEVIGKMLSPTDEDALRLETVINSALLGRETPFFEFSYASAAAGVVDLIINASQRRSPESKTLIGIVFVCQNISEREALEMANTIRAAAEAASQAKTEQLGFLCHEIRNPLNGVMGNIAFLEDSDLSEEQMQLVQTTQQCCTQLMKIMNDVLDLSKIEEGKLSIEIIEFDISDVVRAVLSQIRTTAEAKEVELGSSMLGFPSHTVVFGDPVRVQQILSNFVWNAIKFTEQGSIHVTVSCTPVAGSPSEVDLLFAVVDTGAGISQSAQSKLFQPYVQAEASTTRQYGGTGLGLSICSKLATLMGGRVFCESELGAGSTFSLELRMTAPGQPSAKGKGVKVKSMNPRWHAGSLSPRAKTGSDGRKSPLERARSLSSVGETPQEGKQMLREVTERLSALQAESSSELVAALNAAVGAQWSLRVVREVLQPDHVAVLAEVEVHGCVRQQWGSAPPGPDGLTVATDVAFANACRLVGVTTQQRSRPAASVEAQSPETQERAPLESTVAREQDQGGRRRAAEGGKSNAAAANGDNGPQPVALIVDDEVFNQKIVEVALRKCGFKCQLASDGSDAVQLVTKENRRFDVIIIDQLMKVMNGTVATANIRLHEMQQGLSPTPIICLTGNNTPEDKDSYFLAGMNGVLGKPVKVRNLGKSLLAYIEANRASQLQRQLQLSSKSNQGMVVEYRAVEDLVVFQPVPLGDKDREAYTASASKITSAQSSLQGALEETGINVVIASGADEVIAAVKESRPPKAVSMVLLSEALPGAAGCKQVATQIRQHEMMHGLEPVRILAFLDATPDQTNQEHFFASGMDGIIQRPVNADTIAHSIIAYVQEMQKLRAFRFRELALHKGDLIVEYRRLSDILVFDTQRARANADARKQYGE